MIFHPQLFANKFSWNVEKKKTLENKQKKSSFHIEDKIT